LLRNIFSSDILKSKCNAHVWFLAVLWVVCLFFGRRIALQTEDYLFAMMHTAVSVRVSIVDLLVLQLIPFCLSALAVYISVPYIIYPVCAVKAFLGGYSLGTIGIVYGDAGWLIRFLYLFTDTIMSPLLLWYWFKHISGANHSRHKHFKYVLLGLSAAAALEYFVISPFLVVLMNR